MKICIICDVLGEENNGTTIAAMNLIRSLKSKNYDLKIICCNKDKTTDSSYYILPERNFLILNPIIHRNDVRLAKLDKKKVINWIKDADHIHF